MSDLTIKYNSILKNIKVGDEIEVNFKISDQKQKGFKSFLVEAITLQKITTSSSEGGSTELVLKQI